jgi:hypothetical protein
MLARNAAGVQGKSGDEGGRGGQTDTSRQVVAHTRTGDHGRFGRDPPSSTLAIKLRRPGTRIVPSVPF